MDVQWEAYVMTEAEQISQIVRDILDSYGRVGGTNYVSRTKVPSQQHIIDIMRTLRMLLFPGYYDHEAIEEMAMPYVTGERVVWLHKHLSVEINRCLCFECRECEQYDRLPECGLRSGQIALELLRAIPEIRAALQLDVRAVLEGDPAAHSADEVILAYPSLAAITVHRVAHFLYQHEVPLLSRIMSEEIHHRTGIDIHPGATIGEFFSIDHGTGVVIGETTEIGDDCKLYQGVTLGAFSFPKDEGGELIRGRKRHPTLEDRVTVYAGTTILGGETVIGHDSIIGGNVWVTESVPPGTKVLIEHPKLVYKEGDEERGA